MQKPILPSVEKNRSGITLIALVITVIILIILASITLQLTLGDNGIIQNAKKAKIEYEIESYKERVEIARQNVAIDNLGEVTLEKLVDQIYKEDIVPQGNIIKQDENSQKMTTQEGYEFILTKDSIEYIEKGNIPEEPPVDIIEGTVEIGTPIWDPNTHKASVTIAKTNGVDNTLQIQYQINGYEEDKWLIAEDTVTGLSHNDTIYARLWNGSIGGKDYASRDIKDGDKPNVNIKVTATQTNSITISITVEDNQSGMPETPKYTYAIKKTQHSDSEYEQKEDTITTKSFEGLEQATSYTIRVESVDRAGNVGSETIEVTTQTVDMAAGNITTTTETWDLSTHTASISIGKAQGIGNNLQIQYQINGYGEGKWATGTTVSDLMHNDIVYIRLSDGVNAGNYTSREIKDGDKPQDAQISWTTGTTVSPGENITAQVILQDNESGVNIANSKWMLTDSTNPIGEEGNYTGSFTGNSTTQNIITSKSDSGTYFLHVLTQDNAGNKKETVYIEGITVGTSINDLKAGDYVRYDAGTNGIIICRVLYPVGSEHGLQIISDKNVGEDITLGGSTWEEGKTSYNGAITTLNNEAQKYVNNKYAYDGRCVGSIPTVQNGMFVNKNKVRDSEANIRNTMDIVSLPEKYFIPTGWTSRDTGCYNTDFNYTIDETALKETKIWNTGQSYWLASRWMATYSDDTYRNFHIRYLNTNSGAVVGKYLCYVAQYGTLKGFSGSNGFRPCISLKSDVIKITGGDGTQTDPYTLGL